MKLERTQMSSDFNQKRTDMYKDTIKHPGVRYGELTSFGLIEDRSQKKIIDIASGNGYLTEYLLKLFPNAKVIAQESSGFMRENNNIDSDRMEIIEEEIFDTKIKSNSLDLAFSLASFHHINNKKNTLREINRILKPNGQLFIADVADNTPAQKFFDKVVSKHCITGHNFDFLDNSWIKYLAEETGFKLVSSKVKETPWIFDNKKQMLDFVKNLTGLEISDKLLLKFLKEIFKIEEDKDKTVLQWQLGYYLLKK